VDEILARHTGQPMEKVSADTERDSFLSPEEAKEYGILDDVISDRTAGIQSGWQPDGSRKQEA
jgi:ATP-dependent Clp protease protease subunit